MTEMTLDTIVAVLGVGVALNFLSRKGDEVLTQNSPPPIIIYGRIGVVRTNARD